MMRLIARISLGLITLGAAPITACAQTPGTRLQGTVEVVGLEVHGDTVAIRYKVRADASTPEPFFALTLPLTHPAILVRVDTTSRTWRSTNRVGRQSVASWAYVGDAQMLVSPSLSFTAIGVPELADAWITGYHEPFVEGTLQADSAGADTTGYRYGSRKIRVVGVGPRASTLSLDQRFARLSAGLSERCRLGYVTPQGLCNSLSAKLAATQNSLARGNTSAARGQLTAFKTELSAQRGKGVDDTTYWFLSALAEIAIAGLPAR